MDENRFPAGVQSAIELYQRLISVGVGAKNIIISGDSTGGNVDIALLRYLQCSHTHLPLPKLINAFSPRAEVISPAGDDYDRTAHSKSSQLPCLIETAMPADPRASCRARGGDLITRRCTISQQFVATPTAYHDGGRLLRDDQALCRGHGGSQWESRGILWPSCRLTTCH